MDSATTSSTRRPWTAPAIVDLPPLRELTLLTAPNAIGEQGTFSY